MLTFSEVEAIINMKLNYICEVTNMKFGEKLRKLRVEKGLTQKEVADKLKISPKSYIAYEKNNIRPRKQETYDKLANILGCEKNYLLVDDDSGLNAIATAAGFGLIGAGLSVFSPIAAGATVISLAAAMATSKLANMPLKVDKLKESDDEIIYNNEALIKYENNQKKFRATAMGIIISALVQKGYNCQMGDMAEITERISRPDGFIRLPDNYINTWWLSFWSKDDELDKYSIVFPEDRAHVMFSKFSTVKPDPKRKISIVVDDKKLFEELCEFKDRNSFRGNMSVILIDLDEVGIKKEVFISYYDDSISDKLFVLDDEGGL